VKDLTDGSTGTICLLIRAQVMIIDLNNGFGIQLKGHQFHYLIGHTRILTFLKVSTLTLLLYLFILSITLLGDSVKLLGQGYARELLNTTANPLLGLFIGLLATSIIQSSSTTTSIVVGMVGGGLLTIEGAIPIIMGANIGTTITNTLVSMNHITRFNEFRRAYTGAVMHDVYNILTVICLFPLQYFTNFLGIISSWTAENLVRFGGLSLTSPIKTITDPVSSVFIDLSGQHAWLSGLGAIILLFFTLRLLVAVLKSLVLGRIEIILDRFVMKTIFRALLLGLLLTALVQSSSITTSLVIPLIGAGVLSIRKAFPYTLGANLGTTVTAIFAALVTSNISAITVAFAHFYFNVAGIIIFLPLSNIPIRLAEGLAALASRSKIIPLAIILVFFFFIPALLILIMR
jgi:sodium-dependent phosphate cotransporter